MLYLAGWKYSDLIYIIFSICILCAVILLLKLKKYIKNNGKYRSKIYSYYIFGAVLIFLSIILSIICVIGIGQKIYCINAYNNKNYCVVEGSVQNLEYVYENNSNKARGIRFVINETVFNINNGILNSGYSFDDGIIKENGGNYKIYYIPPNTGEEVSLILRIDSE